MQKALKPPFLLPSAPVYYGGSILTDRSDSQSPAPRGPSPLEYHTVLPAIYDKKEGGHTAYIPDDNVSMCLDHDLDVSRLNYIDKKLWLAGRPMNYKSLHQQKMIRREILITEQTDLHLTWSESTIFIKPFPRFLGNHEFWIRHLCHSEELHQAACGLLFSYTRLIYYESDFNLAQGLNLVPLMPWTQWRAYIQDARRTLDAGPPSQINPRYLYGELRLARLNWIYRFYGRPQDRSFIRGYLYGYRTYRSFFAQHFTWIFVAFAYVTIVLTAMQVGLATELLQAS